MDTLQVITPTLGKYKPILIGLFAAAIGGYVATVAARHQGITGLTYGKMLPIGCLYGSVAAGCWLSTAIEHRYLRLIGRSGLVVAATVALGTLRETRPVLQTAADFSGLAIVQSLLFFWFRLPAWRVVQPSEQPRTPARIDQYSIADVIIVTTVVAMILAMALRYSPAIQPIDYWGKLVAIWVGGSLIAYLIARGMLAHPVWKALLWLTLGVALAYAGTYAVAIADSLIDHGRLIDNPIRAFAGYYGRIVVGFVSTFALFAALGRV